MIAPSGLARVAGMKKPPRNSEGDFPLYNVIKDGKEVKDGAEQDENMPDDVMIGDLFIDVEESSNRINNSPRYK